MKKFTVEIKQTRCGYVDIEARSIEEALDIAEKRFNVGGEELPEMDDVDGLDFDVVRAVCEGCLAEYDPRDMAGSSLCVDCEEKLGEPT